MDIMRLCRLYILLFRNRCIQFLIQIYKDIDKTGSGVTDYLPSCPHEMMDKLGLLYGELTAGNRAVIPQIVALLGKLHQKGQLSYKDYKYFCEQTGSCAQY